MREILFKARREDNGEWVEGYCVCYLGKYPYIYTGKFEPINYINLERYEVDPETVCQYTGWEDKNGEKIFEGDIISYLTTKGAANQRMTVGEVTFAEGSFFVRNGRFWRFLYNDNYKVKIIGNIFDNPELLEVEE